MDLIDELVDFFQKPESQTKDKTPNGLCPVCWGYQEYDKTIRKKFRDKQIDVNNQKDRYLLIQDFVTENIEGIKLKEPEDEICPKCSKSK